MLRRKESYRIKLLFLQFTWELGEDISYVLDQLTVFLIVLKKYLRKSFFRIGIESKVVVSKK